MRPAIVLGTVTLSRALPEMAPGQYLLVAPQRAAALRAKVTEVGEVVVAYDELGAPQGGLVAVADGREASMPFRPKDVPCDHYCAAILDVVHVSGSAAAGEEGS
ncbi:MAG: carbon dioxide concentrating mechanism protein CcmL [Planctomycetes bacterium]|nr:carbon dioxide concentrating mechanism protein CcmL [Planctomycetota bacterium]